MPDEPAKTEPAEDEDDASETSLEFQALFEDASKEQNRMKKLAAAAKEEGKTDLAAIYGEVAGTVLQLQTDLIAACGGAFDACEARLDDLEEEESRLTAEDAQRYLDAFEAYLHLIEELEKALPEDGADEQRKMFAGLRNETEGLIDLTREIGDLDDEPGPAGADAPAPAN